MQSAEYCRYFFGGESRGRDTTEPVTINLSFVDRCGPEWTETAVVKDENERKPFDGNRHERRKAAAIDRSWEKRRKKEAKP
jgi:hypothetical protein